MCTCRWCVWLMRRRCWGCVGRYETRAAAAAHAAALRTGGAVVRLVASVR